MWIITQERCVVKRSKALEELEYHISDYLGEKINHPDVLANILLNELEKLGMLPPMQTRKNGKPKENLIPYVDYCIRQWEPENE
jgi:hypothetical protein